MADSKTSFNLDVVCSSIGQTQLQRPTTNAAELLLFTSANVVIFRLVEQGFNGLINFVFREREGPSLESSSYSNETLR